jgi:hypothetical protein
MTGDLRSARPTRTRDADGGYAQPAAGDVQSPTRSRLARRPAQGLSGLLLVVPVAVFLAFAVDGAQGSTIVLGPLAAFALAPTAMIAFWWENWPGTRLRPSWSGWADTLLIAVIAVALTIVGQRLVGRVDLRGIFSQNPGPGHSPVFPITLTMAGAAFVAIMQLTFVCERWPFERLSWMVGGLATLVAAWAVALVLFFGLVSFHPHPSSGLRSQNGPLAPAELGALLVITGLWQVWFYITWQGWPFTRIADRSTRLLAGNLVVVGAGILTFLIAKAAGMVPVNMIALAGSFIAAALVHGLLFDGWLPGSPKPSSTRVITIVLDLVLAAILFAAVNAYADHLHWTIAHPTEWVAQVMLNAIAFSVILHVAIGRRWPFGRNADSAG